MKTLKTLEPLATRLLEIQRINSAAAVLSWDQETYMPAGGGAARAEQIAVLQGIAHGQLVSTETERMLGNWLDLQTGVPLERDGELWDESSRALLREVWRDYSRAKKLPTDFVIRLSRESSLAQQVWAEAKARSDYKSFLPNLRTVLSLKREEAHHLGFEGSPYNALLDAYEPESTVSTLVPLFAQLKARLGDKMGDPIECEHTNVDNGDSLMQTTTGLAFYRKATNTPTFTNGFEHWALTAQGLVYWTGDSIDPPLNATPVP